MISPLGNRRSILGQTDVLRESCVVWRLGETSRSRAIPGKGRQRIAGEPGDPEERGDRRSQGRQKGGQATGEGGRRERRAKREREGEDQEKEKKQKESSLTGN